MTCFKILTTHNSAQYTFDSGCKWIPLELSDAGSYTIVDSAVNRINHHMAFLLDDGFVYIFTLGSTTMRTISVSNLLHIWWFEVEEDSAFLFGLNTSGDVVQVSQTFATSDGCQRHFVYDGAEIYDIDRRSTVNLEYTVKDNVKRPRVLNTFLNTIFHHQYICKTDHLFIAVILRPILTIFMENHFLPFCPRGSRKRNFFRNSKFHIIAFLEY